MKSDNKLIFKTFKGLNYMQFTDLLEMGIKHAYTLKSEGFDFSFGVKEEQKSYDILSEALEIDRQSIIQPIQTHTDKVLCIDMIPENLNNVDGLITNKSGLSITTKNADCILFLFYDPVKKVIANVHSGWKGTFQKIAEKTVIKMISNYGCKPENIKVYISPSIRGCHFEVESDVYDLCKGVFDFTQKTDQFITKGITKNGIQKYNIDTVMINKILLLDLGIKKENIIDSEICSVCEKERFHSARAEGKNFKRGTAIIVL